MYFNIYFYKELNNILYYIIILLYSLYSIYNEKRYRRYIFDDIVCKKVKKNNLNLTNSFILNLTNIS